MVAEKHGYSLLWVVRGLDAFFIRNDLIDDGSGRICFPFSKWKQFTGIATHKPLQNPRKIDIFIDYEVYLRTSGDIARSRESASRICKKWLLDSTLTKIMRKASRLLRPVINRLKQSR